MGMLRRSELEASVKVSLYGTKPTLGPRRELDSRSCGMGDGNADSEWLSAGQPEVGGLLQGSGLKSTSLLYFCSFCVGTITWMNGLVETK